MGTFLVIMDMQHIFFPLAQTNCLKTASILSSPTLQGPLLIWPTYFSVIMNRRRLKNPTERTQLYLILYMGVLFITNIDFKVMSWVKKKMYRCSALSLTSSHSLLAAMHQNGIWRIFFFFKSLGRCTLLYPFLVLCAFCPYQHHCLQQIILQD